MLPILQPTDFLAAIAIALIAATITATLLTLCKRKRCVMCGISTTGFNVLCRDCRAWYRMRRNGG